MKYHHRFLAAAVLALAHALLGQTTENTGRPAHRGGGADAPSGKGGPGGRGNPVIRTLDTNHDHEISAQEISLAPTVLPLLDLDGNGVVSIDELRPMRPEGFASRRTPPDGTGHPLRVDPVMFALDANADGNLAAAEIANAAGSLRALDENQDGKLTRDELRPLPPSPPRN